jgi:predicted dehydrogenase
MPASPVNLAFLGCGKATRTHTGVLRGLAPEVGRWYASRNPATAEQYRRELGGAGVFGSYAEAMTDSRIQAVVVATTPDSHLPLVLQALDAGKHVVVEKPAFLRAADFDRVLALEAASGLRVMVAENYCYKPLARALTGIITSGDLGEVRFLSLVAVKQQRSHGWRDDETVAGGGALFEGGVHWVDLLANAGLEVASVRGYRPGPREGLERSMLVVVRYASGGVGMLAHSWEIPSPLRGVRISRIYGTAGSVAFESNGIFLLQTGRRFRLRFPGFRDITGNRTMWTDFLDVIRTGRQPVMTGARARRGLEIVEAAYASAERPV